MNLIIMMAASLRYFNQYDWDSISLPNNFAIAVICSNSDLDKFNHQLITTKLGCDVIQIDGEPNAKFMYKNLYSIAKNICINYSSAQIICIDEGCLDQANKLKKDLNLNHTINEYESILSNKEKVYAKLSSSHFNAPKSLPISLGFDQIVKEISLPFIIKPLSSSGSFEVSIIHNQNDFEIIKQNPDFEYIANQFIQGDLYHCDLQFSHGKLIFSAAGLYLNPLLEFKNGKNIGSFVIDPTLEISESLSSFCQNCLKLLCESLHGSFHVEVFNQAGEWIFLEAANRPPGGAVIPLYQKAYGINLCNQDLYIHLGLETNISWQFKPSFAVAAPHKKGSLSQINLPKLNVKYDCNVYVKEGDLLEDPKSIANKALTLFSQNDSYDILLNDYIFLKEYDFLETTT